MLFPVAILAERTIGLHSDSVLQWLIQWKNRSMDEATWEDALVIKSQFPDASLEDKTLIEGRRRGVVLRIQLLWTKAHLSQVLLRYILEGPKG